MLFGLVGSDTKARRLPGRFQVPWKEILLVAIVLVALAALAFAINAVFSRVSDEPAAPAVPEVPQPVAPPVRQVPAVSNPQLPQNVQENVDPTAPVVVDYRVVWRPEDKGFDPFTIPVEEGFYSGHSLYSLYPGANENQLGSVPPVRYAYAWGVLPHLKGLPVAVAAARDETNKDIVLIALDADRYGPYILLSVNGPKPEILCKLNLLPVGTMPAHGDAIDVRVVQVGGTIHLHGQDSRVGDYWWEAVVKKSELPCS